MSKHWEFFMVRREDSIGLGHLSEFATRQASRLLTGNFEGWEVALVTRDHENRTKARELLDKLEEECCPFVLIRWLPYLRLHTPSVNVGYCLNQDGSYFTECFSLYKRQHSLREVAEVITVTNPLNGHWVSEDEDYFISYSLAFTSTIPNPENQVEWCKFAKAMAIIGGE